MTLFALASDEFWSQNLHKFWQASSQLFDWICLFSQWLYHWWNEYCGRCLYLSASYGARGLVLVCRRHLVPWTVTKSTWRCTTFWVTCQLLFTSSAGRAGRKPSWKTRCTFRTDATMDIIRCMSSWYVMLLYVFGDCTIGKHGKQVSKGIDTLLLEVKVSLSTEEREPNVYCVCLIESQ